MWVLNLKTDGKFDVTQNGEDAVQGKYKVSKTQIEFVDESGPLAEPNAKEGTYQWKYEDDKLIFDKINDAAEGRSSTLTAGSWDKKKDDLVLSTTRNSVLGTIMATTARILIADDQADVREALRLLLKGEKYETEDAESPSAVLKEVGIF